MHNQWKANLFHSPVCFAVVLEVVHVAAGGGVQSVLRLHPLGPVEVQQVSVVFHHKLSFGEAPGGEHAPPLVLDVPHLFNGTLQFILKRNIWSKLEVAN